MWLRTGIMILLFFFFNDTATTEIYTLSLHDALPISSDRLGGERVAARRVAAVEPRAPPARALRGGAVGEDRKSTRLNSSHANISYAVFCLKKKKIKNHSLSTLTYALHSSIQSNNIDS